MIDLTQTPKRLKLSILNYALSGKLTQQLPSDGTANDLLKPILQRKYELLKNKKIRKHKKLSPVNKAPFKIPNNWTWIHFSSLYDMVGGSQPPKATFISHPSNNYIRLYQTRDYGPSPKPVYIPKNKARKITNKGDILVARYGGSLGEIFKASYGAYNVALARVTPIILSKELNKGYIWYYLKSDFYQKFVRTLNKSAQAGFNKRDLLKLIIPVPPLAEQERIVQRLDQILPKIDDLNKDVVRLHSIRKAFPYRLKQSLLMEAMQGNLTKQLPSDGNADELLQKIQQKKQDLIKAGRIRRHKKLPPISRDEIPFKIPSNWKWVRITDISTFPDQNQIKPINISPNTWVLDLKDISENTGIIKNYTLKRDKKVRSNKNIFNKDDVLYGKLRPYLNKVVVADRQGVSTTEIFVLHLLYGINPIFISFALRSPFFLNKVNSDTYGTKMPRAGTKQFKRYIIPLPPLAEQVRIVNAIQKCFSLI